MNNPVEMTPGKRKYTLVPAILTIALVSGCASPGPRQDRITELLRTGASPEVVASAVSRPADLAAVSGSGVQAAPDAIIHKGTGPLLAPPPVVRKQVENQGESVTLEFSDAPLAEVIQALLGDLLKLPFVVEHVPQGTVSLRTGAPVPRDSILPILESMLHSNGAALVRDAQGFYRVTSQEGIQQRVTSLHRPDSLPQGYGLVVVPLRFVGASEMAEIIRPVAPAEAIIRVDPLRNLLILAGTRGQHEGWLEIVRTFDVDFLKGMSLGIYPLEYASVEDVFDAVGVLLGREPGSTASGGESTTVGSAVRLVPIKRLNSLIAVSSRPEHLQTVREWVARLDQPAVNDLEPRLYVYPVQNGTASHLAELLRALYGGRSASSDLSARKADSGVAPGLRPTSLQDAVTGAKAGSGGAVLSGNSPASGAAMTLPDADSETALVPTEVGLGDEVKVVADERTNALLILAPRKDYRKIEAALRQIDVAPNQVLIEASIVEVRLTDDLKHGLEWTFSSRLGGGRTGGGMLNLNREGGIGPAQPGFSFTVTGSGGDIRAVLNALAQDSLLRVLSSPSLLVLDNHTASIHVGDQQPVQTGTTVGTNSLVTTTIEYRDTGVMLSVTPSVNAGGLVGMTIHQTITDIGDIDQATGQRSFLQRQFKSRVSVRSGETIVMGGLIRERSANGRAGVPVLHDIPVVGNLFGTSTNEKSSTELLVLITPRVIASDAELRAVSDELRTRMHAARLRPADLGAGPVPADR